MSWPTPVSSAKFWCDHDGRPCSGNDCLALSPDAGASIQLPPIVVKADSPTRKFYNQAEEEPPINLSKAQISPEPLELAGRIITVNNEHKFVVIDIGRDDQVKIGMSFDVYRRGKEIGKIEVIETRRDIAACDIKEISVRQFKANDTVRR